MGKFKIPPKAGSRCRGPYYPPVAPVDTAEDIKLELIAENLKKELEAELPAIAAQVLLEQLKFVIIDGGIIE